jgi:hypothetical protein
LTYLLETNAGEAVDAERESGRADERTRHQEDILVQKGDERSKQADDSEASNDGPAGAHTVDDSAFTQGEDEPAEGKAASSADPVFRKSVEEDPQTRADEERNGHCKQVQAPHC